MTRIDLHAHTTASDGSLTPANLVFKAYEEGLVAIAVTDHDTLDGLEQATEAGNAKGIKVLPGVELSVNYEDGSLHLLGYGIDYHNVELNNTITSLRNSRSERNGKIIAKLNEMGYTVSISDVLKISGGGSVGRGHISQALIQAGYFKSVEETFEHLLNRGAPAYIDRFRLDLETAIALIHRAGGIAVWAHPGLHGNKLEKLLGRLSLWTGYGLDGMESDYSQHSIELRDHLRKTALSHDIIYTGGSDFHGDLKPDIELGQGPEGQPIDPRCLEMAESRLEVIRSRFNANN